jgi:hypothetical protein
MANNSGYQSGTTADPSTSRKVIASVSPQVVGSVNSNAQMTTNFGNNADVQYIAKTLGAPGNLVTVNYVVAGNSTALSVSVTSNAITVNLATSAGGAATSTATQVAAAVNASGPASALVTAAVAPNQTGAGVPTAMSATLLSGGAALSFGGQSNAPTPKIPPIHNTYA